MSGEAKEKINFTYEFHCPVCKEQASYQAIVTMPIVGQKPSVQCKHCGCTINIEFYADSRDGELKAKISCIQLSQAEAKKTEVTL